MRVLSWNMLFMASCPEKVPRPGNFICAALCRIQNNDYTAVVAPGVHVTALHVGTSSGKSGESIAASWCSFIFEDGAPAARTGGRTEYKERIGRSLRYSVFPSCGVLCLAPCPCPGACCIDNYSMATSQLYATSRGELKTVAWPRAHGTGRRYTAHFFYVAVLFPR